MLAGLGLLTACMPYQGPQVAWPVFGAQPPAAPAPEPAMAQVPVQPAVGALPPPAGRTALRERQPDLCGASRYASAVGQPGSVVPGLGVTGDHRIVEHRGIVQQEYQAYRLNFRLDENGIITRVDCG